MDMTHPDILRMQDFGKEISFEHKLLFECGCGHQVYEDSGESYITVDGEDICKNCMDGYVMDVFGSYA